MTDVVRVPSNHRVHLPADVVIEVGGRLEVGPGTTVAVAAGKGIYVRGGALVAKGTADARIVFTSASATPRPGDWCGIVVDWPDPPHTDDPPAWPTTTVEHAVIEFAGRPWNGKGVDERAGGFLIQGYLRDEQRNRTSLAGRVVLSNVELRENALRGLDVRTDAPLEWKNLRFGPNGGVSARIDVENVHQLGTAPTEAIELLGDVRRSIELPRIPREYVVVERLLVGSWSTKGPPAVLTIPPGTTLRFKKDTELSIGHMFVGRLVAHGATFTSAEWQPAPGDWLGIHVGELGSMELDGDTFEYADEHAVGWFIVARPRIQLQRTTFRHNKGAPIFDPVSCAKWENPALGIVSDRKPLCSRVWNEWK